MSQTEVDALKAAVEKLSAVLARKPGVAAISERQTGVEMNEVQPNGR